MCLAVNWIKANKGQQQFCHYLSQKCRLVLNTHSSAGLNALFPSYEDLPAFCQLQNFSSIFFYISFAVALAQISQSDTSNYAFFGFLTLDISNQVKKI